MLSSLPQKTPYLSKNPAQFWKSHIRKANPWDLSKLTCFRKNSHQPAPTAYSRTPLESGSQPSCQWAPIAGLWTSPIGSSTSVFQCCWCGPAVNAMPLGHYACSRSSASGYCCCRDTVPSRPKFRTFCYSIQHLFHSARSAASSWNRPHRVAPSTQWSLLPCQKTGDTAKVDPSLTHSKQKPETSKRK